MVAAACLQQWTITLSSYSYNREYKYTSQHVNTDSSFHVNEMSQDAANVSLMLLKLKYYH